jgi:hypothetical protein
MNRTEAITLANKHIELLNSINPQKIKFTWKISEPREVNGGWYFDYEFVMIDEDDIISIEGAPGFMVNKTNSKIEDLSWDLYHEYNLGVEDPNRHREIE